MDLLDGAIASPYAKSTIALYTAGRRVRSTVGDCRRLLTALATSAVDDSCCQQQTDRCRLFSLYRARRRSVCLGEMS